MTKITEEEILSFWNTHPCGENQVEKLKGDYEDFFLRYDGMRYSHESHSLRQLDTIDWQGQRVLEIGLGQGAEAEQIIRRGAIWSGVDLTAHDFSCRVLDDPILDQVARGPISPFTDLTQG